MLLEIGQDLSDVAGVGVCFPRRTARTFACCQAQAGADFQQLQTDRRALGLGERRTGQAQPTQAVQQAIGEGREVQPQLVRPQGGTAGAIGEQSQLLLLDPVLFGASLRLTPSGLARKFIPDEFFPSRHGHSKDLRINVGHPRHGCSGW